ncbi:hypothetical protein ACJMK2_004360, partial [Sinanodonta woodiana]
DANIRATTLEEEVYAGLRRFRGREKQKHVRLLKDMLPPNKVNLQHKGVKDTNRQQRHEYYVKIAVLADSGVYDLYASSVRSADPFRKSKKVREKITYAYSHVINGVNLRFKTIDDPSISITVILQHFTVFQREDRFPHKSSQVFTDNGETYIAAHPYASDIKQWVLNYGIHLVPKFDHAMLFTGYELYRCSIDEKSISGVSFVGRVCDEVEKVSLIQSKHYARTVLTASHAVLLLPGDGILGFLGADHDGTADAKDCHPNERFIMYHRALKFNETTPYSGNEWIFSKCSVESFKKTLLL